MSSLVHYSEFKYDLWHYLASSEKPIVMYGMGNGADKILAVFEKFGIEVSDFFASDGFVRGQIFHGKTVLSLSAIKEKYNDFIVVVSFGSSLPEVLANIYSIAERYELYAPDVPVSGDTLFSLDFFKDNFDKFKKAFSLLCDEESKRIYNNIVSYKITGKISHLKEAINPMSCEKELLHLDSFSTFIDCGAYNGDTAKKFINECPNASKIYAIEPDRKNFKKLSAFAENEKKCSVIPFNFGVWNEHSTADFAVGGNRNSGIGTQNFKKTETVILDTVDSLNVCDADYIKYDVEGAEKEALLGSVKTVNSSSPDLLISLYHRSEDLFELPLLANSLFPEYSLFLRRFEYVPAWDINLYAIKRS
ncbi:MAG: FkbM family methyltransferase [Clostridia bacterium]|nr:FkbM family methyltransferase [Clostridia bacterium]